MNGHHEAPGAAPGGKVLDVVCGMWVDPQTAPAHYEYQGQVYYFCAPGCLHLFRENPETYLKSREKQTEGRGPEGREVTGHNPTPAREDRASTGDVHPPERAHAHGHRHRHGHLHAPDRGGHGGCRGCCGHA